MNNSQKFIKALLSHDLDFLSTIPKSDLHNHSSRGGNILDFDKITKRKTEIKEYYYPLEEMQVWYEKNIKPFIYPIKLVELAFKQANNDNIKLLHMSFGLKGVTDYKNYFKILSTLHKKYAPNTIFIPEIRFGTKKDIAIVEKTFNEVIEYDFFKSIDIGGDENEDLIKFRNLYKNAKRNNFILKAHVGEFGDAIRVKETVEALDLDQIQHGINSVTSDYVISMIRERNIQLNICPTSNVKLKTVKNYKTHPIRELFDKRVKVTINTDDMLIFDSSVSEEYMKLYNAKLFSAEELNQIRLQGLSDRNYGKIKNKI